MPTPHPSESFESRKPDGIDQPGWDLFTGLNEQGEGALGSRNLLPLKEDEKLASRLTPGLGSIDGINRTFTAVDRLS